MTKTAILKRLRCLKRSLCSQDSLTPRLEAGTAAKEERDEGGNCHQVPPSKTPRRVKCGKCPACIASDCGNCRACQDKPKFGGPNKIKQACYQRKCQVLLLPLTQLSVCFMQKVRDVITHRREHLFRSSHYLPPRLCLTVKGFLSWNGTFQGPSTSLSPLLLKVSSERKPSVVLH